MTAAVLYLRVSTVEQGRSGLGLEAQEAACRDLCSARGLEVLEVVTDTSSGGLDLEKRPHLLQALSIVPRGGCLVAAKRDRIARSAETAALVAGVLRRKRAHLVTCDGPSAEGLEARITTTLIDLFAELEREMGRGRTKAALAARRARGLCLGGSAPYGYSKTLEGRLVPVEAEQAIVRRVTRARSRGQSWAAIAAALNKAKVPARGARWHATTLRRLLARA